MSAYILKQLYVYSGYTLVFTGLFLVSIILKFGKSKVARNWLLFNLSVFVWGVGVVFIGFIVLLVFSVFIVKSKMKFVMFPGEETRSIVITGYAASGTKRYETAELTRQITEVKKRLNPI